MHPHYRNTRRFPLGLKEYTNTLTFFTLAKLQCRVATSIAYFRTVRQSAMDWPRLPCECFLKSLYTCVHHLFRISAPHNWWRIAFSTSMYYHERTNATSKSSTTPCLRKSRFQFGVLATLSKVRRTIDECNCVRNFFRPATLSKVRHTIDECTCARNFFRPHPELKS